MAQANGAERRNHPRFAAHLRVRVRDVEMYTANISRSGMQIACPLTLATVIRRELDSGSLRLELEQPAGGPVAMTSEVRYATEVEDELLIGIQHTTFEGDGEDRYDAFCAEAARKYRAA